MKLSKIIQLAIEEAGKRFETPHYAGLCRVVSRLAENDSIALIDKLDFNFWIDRQLAKYEWNYGTSYAYVVSVLRCAFPKAAEDELKDLWYNFYVWQVFDLLKQGK